MNCDQVFAILTRGPFPTGASTDHAVEVHLSHCDDCRNFAGALRPDNSMDTEAMVAEESCGLPYYWGLAAVPVGESAVSCALPEGRKRSRRSRRKSLFKRHKAVPQLSASQLAFAIVMGASLALLLQLIEYPNTEATEVAKRTESNISATTPRVSAPVNVHDQLLSKLGVTPACTAQRTRRVIEEDSQYGDRPLVVQAAERGIQCCTECHNANSPRLALSATTAKIVRSCQVCHVDPALTGMR